jgi:hypothetical protein
MTMKNPTPNKASDKPSDKQTAKPVDSRRLAERQPTMEPRDPSDPRTDEQKNRDLRDQPRNPLVGAAPIDHTKEDEARAAREKEEREKFAKQADKSQVSTETSADRDAAKDDKTPKSISVTFTGDPNGGLDPVNPEYAGKTFEKGKAVVIDDHAWIRAHAAGLRQNNHFRVE